MFDGFEALGNLFHVFTTTLGNPASLRPTRIFILTVYRKYFQCTSEILMALSDQDWASSSLLPGNFIV